MTGIAKYIDYGTSLLPDFHFVDIYFKPEAIIYCIAVDETFLIVRENCEDTDTRYKYTSYFIPEGARNVCEKWIEICKDVDTLEESKVQINTYIMDALKRHSGAVCAVDKIPWE